MGQSPPLWRRLRFSCAVFGKPGADVCAVFRVVIAEVEKVHIALGHEVSDGVGVVLAPAAISAKKGQLLFGRLQEALPGRRNIAQAMSKSRLP